MKHKCIVSLIEFVGVVLSTRVPDAWCQSCDCDRVASIDETDDRLSNSMKTFSEARYADRPILEGFVYRPTRYQNGTVSNTGPSTSATCIWPQ